MRAGRQPVSSPGNCSETVNCISILNLIAAKEVFFHFGHVHIVRDLWFQARGPGTRRFRDARQRLNQSVLQIYCYE